jgi:hypothetical protein
VGEALLVGDFNFDNSEFQESSIFINADYVDQLSKFGIPDKGPGSYTKFKTPKQKASRPDKILYRGSGLDVTYAQICGKFCTPFYAEDRVEMVE